jgi:uncharacterized protein YsxB (DUF464 family)
MIKVKFNPKNYTLDVKGHANHGKKGEDIVCAAISTLFYTLAESLYQSKDMLAEDFVFKDDNGNGHISCKPKPEYEANISLMYMTILNGFQLVADNYKKNIKFEIVVSH